MNNNNEYTGRTIAIFTDPHALYEPTKAILEDMTRRGIKEIYSLGDNIGVGPNPREVLSLLEEYHVCSIAGNSEEYITLGLEPFASYMNPTKARGVNWTKSQLTERQIGMLTLFPHSISLLLGGQKLALCHFSNDVRCDFSMRSTWSYQTGMTTQNGRNQVNEGAHTQFLYTNSTTQKKEFDRIISERGVNPSTGGYVSAQKDPLFNGDPVSVYNAVIQGHTHFEIYDAGPPTFLSIRAVGMAYGNDAADLASYVILREKTNNAGYDLEKILVPYDREQMLDAIKRTPSPDRETIMKFTSDPKKR